MSLYALYGSKKNKNMKNILTKQSIISLLVALVIGLVIGKFIFSKDEEDTHAHDHESATASIWTCSMHPSIKQNEPGKCPICGMDLTPIEDNDGDDDPKVFKMSERNLALANLTYSKVRLRTADEVLSFSAKIKADERRQQSQSMHFPGRIEQLFVNFEGESVQAGQSLATVYSPNLFNAQEELIQAKKEGDEVLLKAAKSRLERWRLSQKQIETILTQEEASPYFTIKADFSGYLIEKMVSEGDYLNRGEALFRLADLSQVWVILDVFEKDLSKIQKGQKLIIDGPALAGRKLEAKIDYINPVINAERRTATVRATIDNRNGQLLPEMLVQASLQISHPEKLLVPASAVMWTGERSVVYLADGKGNFELRQIHTGLKLGEFYEVLEGLEEGEQIVSRGTFTVDAAAQLAGKYAMMNPKTDEALAEKIKMDESSSQHLTQVVRQYTQLKDVLVKTEANNKADVNQLKKLLQQDFNSSLEGQELGQLRRYFKQMSQTIQNWPDEIEAQRQQFKSLSDLLIDLLNDYQWQGDNLYVQYCPMVNDNEGASWLSFEEEIYNPYFGNVMLHCGEVLVEM